MKLSTMLMSPDDHATWAGAAKLFTEEQLVSATHSAIKWAPAILPLSGQVFFVSRDSIPPAAWGAMLEMESWGAARRHADPDGEAMLVSQSLLEFVMRAIQLLLEGLSAAIGAPPAVKRSVRQNRDARGPLQLTYEADGPSLG